MKEKAEEWLNSEWRDLRDDLGPDSTARVVGAIVVLEHIGVFTMRDRQFWMLRIQTCPGHDDEGGRSWCAYCGEMK